RSLTALIKTARSETAPTVQAIVPSHSADNGRCGRTMSPQTEPVQISTVSDPAKDAGESIVGILIASKRLTDTQLRYARRVQSKLANPKTLLNVLRDLEYVTEAQLSEAVSSLQIPIELGDLLVELGKITPAQLEAAVAMQLEDASKTVGDVLVEKG